MVAPGVGVERVRRGACGVLSSPSARGHLLLVLNYARDSPGRPPGSGLGRDGACVPPTPRSGGASGLCLPSKKYAHHILLVLLFTGNTAAFPRPGLQVWGSPADPHHRPRVTGSVPQAHGEGDSPRPGEFGRPPGETVSEKGGRVGRAQEGGALYSRACPGPRFSSQYGCSRVREL